MFYSQPWVSLIVLTATYVVDLIFGWRQKIFKTRINNASLVMENSLFLVVSVMYGRILLASSDYDRKVMSGVGWIILTQILLGFILLLVFKIMGQNSL